MNTVNISLTGELAEYVEEEVSSGVYASASDVVREALLLLRHERDVGQETPQWQKEAVREGIEAAERGEFSHKSVDDILQEVLAGRRL